MRSVSILRTLSLVIPLAAAAVALPAQKPRASVAEKFEVSGLPKTPTTALEKEIFTLLRVHKKGDLADATRIHIKLAEYYKLAGDQTRAADCTKAAEAAWNAMSGDAPATSASSPGTPPFEPAGTFEGAFVYTDELKVEHRWEFYGDGTYAHRLTNDTGTRPPSELGWYSVTGETIRLWQLQPKADRQVPFQVADGVVVMNGTTMKKAP